MPNTTYRSVQDVLRNGNVLTKRGTIKNQRSKFPHMKDMLTAIAKKPMGWHYYKTPEQQAKAILEENPAWWYKAVAAAKAPVSINELLDTGDILTKRGTIKTRGSKFPKMKELLAALNQKSTAWRSTRDARKQAYEILAENPQLLV
jgi:hypothetical protein